MKCSLPLIKARDDEWRPESESPLHFPITSHRLEFSSTLPLEPLLPQPFTRSRNTNHQAKQSFQASKQ